MGPVAEDVDGLGEGRRAAARDGVALGAGGDRDVEGVEVEVLLEPGAFGGTGVLDVHPAQATGADLFNACLLYTSRCV